MRKLHGQPNQFHLPLLGATTTTKWNHLPRESCVCSLSPCTLMRTFLIPIFPRRSVRYEHSIIHHNNMLQSQDNCAQVHIATMGRSPSCYHNQIHAGSKFNASIIHGKKFCRYPIRSSSTLAISWRDGQTIAGEARCIEWLIPTNNTTQHRADRASPIFINPIGTPPSPQSTHACNQESNQRSNRWIAAHIS